MKRFHWCEWFLIPFIRFFIQLRMPQTQSVSRRKPAVSWLQPLRLAVTCDTPGETVCGWHNLTKPRTVWGRKDCQWQSWQLSSAGDCVYWQHVSQESKHRDLMFCFFCIKTKERESEPTARKCVVINLLKNHLLILNPKPFPNQPI